MRDYFFDIEPSSSDLCIDEGDSENVNGEGDPSVAERVDLQRNHTTTSENVTGNAGCPDTTVTTERPTASGYQFLSEGSEFTSRLTSPTSVRITSHQSNPSSAQNKQLSNADNNTVTPGQDQIYTLRERPALRKSNPYRLRHRSKEKSKPGSVVPCVADSLSMSPKNIEMSNEATSSSSQRTKKSKRLKTRATNRVSETSVPAGAQSSQAITERFDLQANIGQPFNQPPVHHYETKPMVFPKILSTHVAPFENPPAGKPFRFLLNLLLDEEPPGLENGMLPSTHVHVILPLCDKTDEWALVWIEPIESSGLVIADGLIVSRILLDLELLRSNQPQLSSYFPLEASHHQLNITLRESFGIYSLFKLRRHVFIGPYVGGYLSSRPSLSPFVKILSEKTIPPPLIDIDDNLPDPFPSIEELSAEPQEEVGSSEQVFEHDLAQGVVDNTSWNPGVNQDISPLDLSNNVSYEIGNGCLSEEIEFLGVFPHIKSESQHQEATVTSDQNGNVAEATKSTYLILPKTVSIEANVADSTQKFGRLQEQSQESSFHNKDFKSTLRMMEEKAMIKQAFKKLEFLVAPEESFPSKILILNRAIDHIKRLELRSEEKAKEYETLLTEQKRFERHRETVFSELPPNMHPLYTSFFIPTRIPERHKFLNEDFTLG